MTDKTVTTTKYIDMPWVVERHDQEDGSISYEIWCHKPYERITTINTEYDNANAKQLAEHIVIMHNEDLG